jgi:predicted RNA binding protein YcfA (HicA-like mRNA interferase family)
LAIATYSWQSSHLYAPDKSEILTVPVHANQDLKIGTLSKLLKDAGLTERDL